jgi:hypothetical protein
MSDIICSGKKRNKIETYGSFFGLEQGRLQREIVKFALKKKMAFGITAVPLIIPPDF